MTRLIHALPLSLLALGAGPAMAEDLRDSVRAGVAERTEARLDSRETLPAGDAAATRLAGIEMRLDARDAAGAPRLRPDIRLVRRGTRIEARLED